MADKMATEPDEKGFGKTRLGRITLTAGLSVVAVGVGLVFAEVMLRVTGIQAAGGLFTATVSEFESQPGIFGPNQDTWVYQVAELPYRVRTNSHGYRGAEFPLAKEEGEYRIFYSGDSVTFGDFVEDSETVPAILMDALRERCSGFVRVVNGGLGGSTIREHARLVERGLVLDPDMVVLQFSENDVRDLLGTPMWEELARNREAKSRFPTSVVYAVMRDKALWHLVLRVRAMWRSRGIDQTLSQNADPSVSAAGSEPQQAETRARAEYRQRLEALRDLLAERGVALALVIFPAHHSVYGTWDSDQLEWLRGVAVDLGLQPIEVLDALVEDGRPATELFLMPWDGHVSPEGNRVAVRSIARQIVREDGLAERCE